MTIKTTDYSLKYLKIINYRGDVTEVTSGDKKNSKDIQPQLISITMNEGILESTCHGKLILQDSIDLQQDLPLIGEEILQISYKSRASDEYVEREFYIYKMTDSTRDGKLNTYILEFVSLEHMNNLTKKKYRSFKEQNISDIVTSLIKEISNKDIEVEKTCNNTSFITSKTSPIKACMHLSKIAKSESFEGNSYFFYEDASKFNFKPIEYLFTRKPITYTYFPVKDSNPSPDKLFYSIIECRIPQQFNQVQCISKGMYGSALLTCDPFTRSMKVKTFNYFDSFKKFKHSEPDDVAVNIGSSYFKYKDSTTKWASTISNAGRKKSEYISKACFGDPYICSFTTNEDSLLNRQSQVYQYFDNIVLDITVPGNSNLRAGDIIEIIIPSRSLLDREEAEKFHRNDRFLSGKYLVRELSHVISTSGMISNLRICKDSYNSDHEDEEFVNDRRKFFGK